MHNPLNNPTISSDMKNIFNEYDKLDCMQEKAVYISGATGMIASYLVMFFAYLNENHDMRIEIYAGVRNVRKCRKVFGDLADRKYFHMIEGDVVNTEVSPEIRWDYIIHAASLASPQYYGTMPVEVMLPNVIGTWRLLELAREMCAESFLFFSSGSVYGDVDVSRAVDETTIGRLDYLEYGNMYGESKRCGEAMCKAYCHEYGVPSKAARIHHTYAPTMNIDNDSRVFSEFVGNIVRGEDIVVKSDGTAMRAFCYITDCVGALLRILIEGEDGGVYNIGNPNEYISVKGLAMMLSEISGTGTKVMTKERKEENYCPATVKQRGKLDVGKLNQMGWSPKVGVKEGFSRVIQYLRGENL